MTSEPICITLTENAFIDEFAPIQNHWRRWWGSFHVDDVTPFSITPTKGERS